eukprot:XP_011421640.1 PREDICTED: uncharacterized protein LOC105324280 [Crassostrea gigas]
MASSSFLAQGIITCSLCENPTKQYCNDCQVNLCVDCVSPHIEAFQSVPHYIVSFKNRKIRLVYPSCLIHLGHRCEAMCQQCQIQVCIKCCIGPHKNHNLKAIAKIVEKLKLNIQNETEEIRNNLIPNSQKKVLDIENRIIILTTEYAKLEQERERIRNIWLKEVEDLFDKVGSYITTMRDENLSTLTAHKKQIEEGIQEMIKTVEENNEILKSNKATHALNYISKHEEYEYAFVPLNANVEYPTLVANALGKELNIKIGNLRATLSQTLEPAVQDNVLLTKEKTTLKKPKVVASISTRYKPLHRVACVEENEAWVSGDTKTITRLDVQKYVKETVATNCHRFTNDISVTTQGDLIYSDYENKTVNIVREGKTEALFTTPPGWHPCNLFATKAGDILVNISRGLKNKILRHQGEDISQEIENNDLGKSIFAEGSYSLYLTENSHGDVCVSDLNARSVISVARSGRVRFRYKGASRKRSFDPQCIVTDSLNQIIVTDYSNDCLHMLDQTGQFMRVFNNHGLVAPCGLSIDSAGRLWVGLLHTGNIKVIQYLKN